MFFGLKATVTYDRRFTPVATVIFQMSFLLYSRGAQTDTDWLYRNKRGKTHVFFPVGSGDPCRHKIVWFYLPPIFSPF